MTSEEPNIEQVDTSYAVLSLSGGMDSSSLLLHLLAHGYHVKAVSFDYGQKHRVELERAQALINYICQDLTVSNRIQYRVIKLEGLSEMLNSTLVTGGSEVPEGHYAEENQRLTVVPNRNKIFSSIIQAIALSWANEIDKPVQIAMGIHANDASVYPDCRQSFRDQDYDAFVTGNWDAYRVTYYTPYLEVGKYEILKDAAKSCCALTLDFNEVFLRTNTSYKPIFIKRSQDETSEDGIWYSDYKSASSIERVEAFMRLGRPDPVLYADETGPVPWYVVETYVSKVLEDYEQSKVKELESIRKDLIFDTDLEFI